MNRPWIWLFLLSVFVHLLIWGHPKQVVFDEVTFIKFIDGYLTGKYYFDLHPPLGKLLFALPAFLAGWNPNIIYQKIGDPYGIQPIQALRLLPILCGITLPLLVYRLTRLLNLSIKTALVAGLFVLIENSLLVISSFVLLDVFIIFFGFLSLVLYFESKNRKSLAWFIFSCLAASAAFQIKWSGLSFVGMIFFLELADFRNGLRWKNWILGLASFLGFYAFVFWIHFLILPKSGLGDLFMSPSFQSTLQQNGMPATNPSSMSFYDKFIELNHMMWAYHQTMKQPHPYSSEWMTWPWMKRPIYFWIAENGPVSSRIYLLGNPILWWSAFLSMLLMLGVWIIKPIKTLRDASTNARFIVTLGFVANFLPYLFIGRLTFLYHYLPALVFTLMSLSILLTESKLKEKYIWLFVGICVISFGFFSPLSYGWPMSNEFYQWRVWFTSWY